MVLQVFYSIGFAQTKQLLQIKSCLRTPLVVPVRLQSFQVLLLQVERVTAQEHVDNEFRNVGALLLVCLLFFLRMVNHLLNVIFELPQQIFWLEYLFCLAVVMQIFLRVDLHDLLLLFVLVCFASFLHRKIVWVPSKMWYFLRNNVYNTVCLSILFLKSYSHSYIIPFCRQIITLTTILSRKIFVFRISFPFYPLWFVNFFIY